VVCVFVWESLCVVIMHHTHILTHVFSLFHTRNHTHIHIHTHCVSLSFAHTHTHTRAHTQYEDALAFMEQLFVDRGPAAHVYVHATCATDTGNINTVFRIVKDIVLQSALEDAGLFNAT
jgi:hypothetical protein